MSALDNIIQTINDSPDKGKLYEKLCAYFLKHDRLQQAIYSDVYLWDEWPGNEGNPDTGIDIVANLTDSDSLCAVQCKFRQDDSAITKSEIDSFLALSSKEIFSQRILFALTDNLSSNAQNAIADQSPPVKIITRDKLEASSIDWSSFSFDNPDRVSYRYKDLLPHQKIAINDVLEGFQSHDKGKLIMACGTGKTFTSLKIAEKFAGIGGLVLVLVPSISLINQSLLAWNYDHDENLPLISFAVCSDSTVGKKSGDEDMKSAELALTPSTNAKALYDSWLNHPRKDSSMTVIFSTYQSLQAIHDAQENGLPRFDLVICDEAHRTAGVTPEGENDSSFRAVHDDSFIHARKRLYMTATPKIFGDTPTRKAEILKKAQEHNAVLYSMDDENIYGPEFHRLSFSQAVDKKLLSDYKVIIFMVKEEDTKELTASAMIDGVCHALAKDVQQEDTDFIKGDESPMRRAVNFTGTIDESRKTFTQNFPRNENALTFTAEHIDGTMSATKRSSFIHWLAQEPSPGECRILSNARCLSEGVDVPALDAVIFFAPKRSQIDIVQSVGRVMRKAEGKKFGYVILPVAIKPGEIPELALDKSKEYKSVWEVLQALRSHDDHFNATINSLDFNGKSDRVRVIDGKNLHTDFTPDEIDAWKQAIYIRMVRKCGDREYWDKWVADLSSVAEAHTHSLRTTLSSPGAKRAFESFADDLRLTINPSITDDDALEMLAQHIISKHVFDELFADFSRNNPISQALQNIVSYMKSYGFSADDSRLENFYSHVHDAVKEAKSETAKQEIIRRIYNNFFRLAFPKTAQKLGIVYTPHQIITFILKSSDWALRKILGIDDGLASLSVNILDPFSGTGTFTAMLIQSGLIPRGRLSVKYRSGHIFANEILLLPYYISAVNIEAAFSQIYDGEYHSFPGIVLTDTFNLSFSQDKTNYINPTFHVNGARADSEERESVNVIIGNPPYSVGQKSANDNNQNTIYPKLRARIKNSYAEKSTATNKNSLYDSYILAFRWASDRLKDTPRGVICFVTNGSFIDSNSADGMRLCLAEEFCQIYIFNLRGNALTSGQLRRNEGDGVFGEGSRCPVAITMLVKDESRKGLPCEIWYYEVGDCLKRDAKLSELEQHESFGKMIEAGMMRRITPNGNGDWVRQRQESYGGFMNLGNKKEERPAIFGVRYSAGVKTNRDAWCYNFSREALCQNMAGMIGVYNSERERWHGDFHGKADKVADYVTNDPAKISWSNTLYTHAKRNVAVTFSDDDVRVSMYRPYVKEYMYFHPRMNEATYQMPQIFPDKDSENLVIMVQGIGSKKEFSVLMTDMLPCLDAMDKSQCFPLYWYERGGGEIFGGGVVRRDGVGDESLAEFRERYNDGGITKRDVFDYVYGVLSSREYAERFGDDAKKVLARVPFVKDCAAFWDFVRAGRELGELHVGYEHVEEWPLVLGGSGVGSRGVGGIDAESLRITRMRIVNAGGEKVIRYNAGLTISGIPACAWDYRVNGRSALEWVVERYRDDTDKASGIRNDCNAWGAGYVLGLIGRVVSVSVRTVKILGGMRELGV